MIPFHPLANLFPLIEGAEFEALVADIKANGLQERIVIHDGQILDGRNRYRAGIAAGLLEEGSSDVWLADDGHFVSFEPAPGGSPLNFIISKNLLRRHLNESQRAMIAARIANMPRGGRRLSSSTADSITVPQAAALMGISERSVRTAKSVIRRAVPEIISAVCAGKIAVDAAWHTASLPAEAQLEFLINGSRRWRARPDKLIPEPASIRGLSITEIRFSAVPRLIAEHEREIVFLRKLANHATPDDPNIRVRDIVGPETLQKMWEGDA